MPAAQTKAATKYVLDVEHPKCGVPYFFPAGRRLQTTIRADRLKYQEGFNPLINNVGEIPGERIEIDLADGKYGSARISHRWGYPEYQERRKEFNRQAVAQRSTRLVDPAWTGEVPPPENYTFHSDDDVATWLFWCRRCVDNGWFKEVQGTIPSMEEIRKIGNIRKCTNYGFHDQNITILKKLESENSDIE